MDLKGFELFNIGDSVSFGEEIYRYLKTGNGKVIDYGLRNMRTQFRLAQVRLWDTQTCIIRIR